MSNNTAKRPTAITIFAAAVATIFTVALAVLAGPFVIDFFTAVWYGIVVNLAWVYEHALSPLGGWVSSWL